MTRIRSGFTSLFWEAVEIQQFVVIYVVVKPSTSFLVCIVNDEVQLSQLCDSRVHFHIKFGEQPFPNKDSVSLFITLLFVWSIRPNSLLRE